MRCRRIRLSRLIHCLKSNCQLIERFVDSLPSGVEMNMGRIVKLVDTPPPS